MKNVTASRRRLFRFVAGLLAAVLSLLLLECLCSVLAWMQFNALDVVRLNALDERNAYTAAIPEGYARVLTPDPYVGHRYGSQFERANNVGTMGRDFPLVKDPAWFTILMVGGSVAEHLAASGELEKAIGNIDGKRVRVLCGAGGGWNQPTQTIMLTLYGDVCDAVVSLDGFNERNRLDGCKLRLEAPGTTFSQLNPLASGGYDRLAASWECNRLRQFSRETNSRAVFYVTRAIRQRIEASAEQPADDARGIWRLPDDWTKEQRAAFNLQQYRKYVSLSDAMAERLGLRVAHFIQPCPAIGKSLTDEERRVVGSLDYREAYQRLASALPAVSLLDCFADVQEAVYVDAVHNNDAGKRIMAERIAAELRKTWK